MTRPIKKLKRAKKSKYCILEKSIENMELEPKGLFTVIR